MNSEIKKWSAPKQGVEKTEHNAYTGIMDTKTIEIKSGEISLYGDLKISSKSLGHKILQGEDGNRDGDMSIADLILETPRKEMESKGVTSYSKNDDFPLVFDNYLIWIKEVGWNGDSVRLEVSQLPEGNIVFLKRNETKTIGNMTVTNKELGISGTQSPYVFFEFVSALKNISDIFIEGTSIAFAGNVIYIKKINVDAGEVEFAIVPNAYALRTPTSVPESIMPNYSSDSTSSWGISK